MADPKKDGGATDADREAQPLPPPDIKVKITPKQKSVPGRSGSGQDEAKKHNDDNKKAVERHGPQIQKDVEREVREHIDKADGQSAGQGRTAQRQGRKDAQQKAGDQAAEKIRHPAIKEVEVQVDGHTTTHKPAGPRGEPDDTQ